MISHAHAHAHRHTHRYTECSGIDEGHHDVSGPSGGGQALVVVGQPARVHEGPPLPGRLHLAVIAQEAAAPPLTQTGTDS